MTTLRWILVPVVAVLAWYAAMLTVAMLNWLYWQFDYPCSYELVTSGGCPAAGPDWLKRYTDVLASTGAALSALYVVIGCTWLAPSHKRRTTLVVFGLGALTAGVLGRSLKMYLPMALAILVGAFTAAFIYRRHSVARVA